MSWQKRPFLADIQVAAVCQTAATKETSENGFIVLRDFGVSLRRVVAFVFLVFQAIAHPHGKSRRLCYNPLQDDFSW
jgi:hypothetical protein